MGHFGDELAGDREWELNRWGTNRAKETVREIKHTQTEEEGM